ncbi:MAG: class I SAM-dependent methyltransferase [Pseudomonadota bacterium]|nr:class I SAM-dependent methyltransferase [Pseudomonadota bacterium]
MQDKNKAEPTSKPKPKLKPRETYADYWNNYVETAFPKVKERKGRDFSNPGDEWGTEQSWANWIDHAFVPADYTNWSYAIEIGGGGGKYTERVLGANDHVRLWGFDVSRSFLDATANRLRNHVDSKRLVLTELDLERPDSMFTLLETEGLVRRIDAVFSIDAMVHVDLQYVIAYWINAALLLKKGGRLVMTLADATSQTGFEKLIRDIKKFYRRQGRTSSKYEFMSPDIVGSILPRLGFEIEYLEQYSPHPNTQPRDLCLIARLERLEDADLFREAIRANPASLSGPKRGKSLAAEADQPSPDDGGQDDERTPAQTQRSPAGAVGHAYWGALLARENPQMTKQELGVKSAAGWPLAREEYTRIGEVVLGQMAQLGFSVTRPEPKPSSSADAEAGGGADSAKGLTSAQKEAARVVGQALAQALVLRDNAQISKQELGAKADQAWQAAREEYSKLGQMLVRRLTNVGYAVAKSQ